MKYRVLYFENAGQEVLSVAWTPPGDSKRAINDNEWFYDTDNLLPVELSSFTGVLDGDQATLLWETSSELNNAGFYVERTTSLDIPYVQIAFIEGAGTSATPHTYSYADNALPSGADVIHYRLKQIDFDGTFSYSNPIALQPTVSSEAVLNPNYPNPFNPTTTLSFSLPIESHVRLAIYDTSGRLITTLLDDALPAGTHTISYEASSDLASGPYIYRLETPQYTRSGTMMLLK